MHSLPNAEAYDGLSEALALFSATFESMVEDGTIVLELPQATDHNIWVFRYILDRVAQAATAETYERRHYDHERMLGCIERHLRYAGHALAADSVRSAIESNACLDRNSADYEALRRIAHMKRWLDFSWGLSLEMSSKGLWPSSYDLARHGAAHDLAMPLAVVPTYLLDRRLLVRELSAKAAAAGDSSAAEKILSYHDWTH